MAPSTETVTQLTEDIKGKTFQKPVEKEKKTIGAVSSTLSEQQLKGLETNHREPLKPGDALDQFEFFDVTPMIGREFVDVDLAEWLRAPNSDEILHEFAITSKVQAKEFVTLEHKIQVTIPVSRRGVVFFRKENNINIELQKKLVQKLEELTGKPESSKLHIHPIANSQRDLGDSDNEISVISSGPLKNLSSGDIQKRIIQTRKKEWHSNIAFEPNPNDYTLLRLTQLPKTGGDTLWASGYELYDRISKPLQGFLDTLTGTYGAPRFNEAAEKLGFALYTAIRGAHENTGSVLEANHPIVRTNPVTGWKSIFAVGPYVQKINGLSEEESRHFLNWFVQLIVENHDLQVRHRWQNENDLAIWDNRSVYHAATPDVDESLGNRSGSRAVSVGERPYFDPASLSRREGLASEVGADRDA